MILSFVALLVSIVVLVVSCRVVVDNASKIARMLGVTDGIIGFFMVAFATSIPELAIAVTSAAEKQTELSVGNILGANIAVIGLVIGLPSLLLGLRPTSTKIDLRDLRREDIKSLYLGLFVASVIPLILANQLYSSRVVGLSLMAVYVLVAYLLYREVAKANAGKSSTMSISGKGRMPILTGLVGMGLAGVVVSAEFVVNTAVNVARVFAISEGIIGATVVAVGTTIPELAVSGVALAKGRSEMAFGNAVGSCSVNITLLLGLGLTINPIVGVFPLFINLTIFTVTLNLLLWYFLATRSVTWRRGGVLFSIYVVYLLIAYLTALE